MRRDDPWNASGLAHLFPNPLCRTRRTFGAGFCNVVHCLYPDEPKRFQPCISSDLLMTCGTWMVLNTLCYLAQCEEYVVRVSPVAGASVPQRACPAAAGAG